MSDSPCPPNIDCLLHVDEELSMENYVLDLSNIVNIERHFYRRDINNIL